MTVADNGHAGEKRQNLDAEALRREAIAWSEAASLAFSRERYLDEDEDAAVERMRLR